jgi:general secretion pathway protein D
MLRLLPIQRLNAILVVSPQPRYLDEVENWIERLDRYDTGKTTGNMHVYRVQNVDAVELAKTLSQIFGGGAAARGTPAAQLAPGLTGGAISGGAFGGTSSGGAFGGPTGGAFGGTGGGAFSGGVGAYQVEDQGMGGTTAGTGTTGGGQIGTPSSSAGGFGGAAGGTMGGGTSGRTATRGSVVAELGNDRRIVADPGNNALITFAKAQDYKDIEAVIKELDVMPLQVLIDATIVEVALTGNLQYGLQWLFTQGQSAEALNNPNISKNGADTAALITTAAAGLAPGGFAYAFAGKDIKVIVHALAKDNKINVVSSPSLMVLNNQEANINVGDRVPTTTGGGIVTTSGSVQSPGIQYVDSGVTLKVRPRVNAGGLVIMDIIQEISTPQDVIVGGSKTFQFRQRKIQSQVAVAGGDTLALGGLIQNTKNVDETGIPYLNKIPGLGWLFGSTSKKVDRTELVVLLTPRVVEKRRDVTTVANEFRRKLTGIFEEYRLGREAPGKSTVAP